VEDCRDVSVEDALDVRVNWVARIGYPPTGR
jgi:hypothetical protein